MVTILAEIDRITLIYIEKVAALRNDKKTQLVCDWLGVLGYHYITVGSAVVW